MKFVESSNSIIKGSKKVPCLICSEPTEYIEVCSEDYFCSSECVNKFYKSYSELLENCQDVE